MKSGQQLPTRPSPPSPSPARHPKYLILYDPYSQFLKYTQTATYNDLYRKIIYIGGCSQKNRSHVSGTQKQKLQKLNHVPTYYVTYFVQDNYYDGLVYLNSMVRVLREKEGRGCGEHDRLLVVVHTKCLCQDLVNNKQFVRAQTISINLQPTYLDLIQPFHKTHQQTTQITKDQILNTRHKQSHKSQIIAQSGLTIPNPTPSTPTSPFSNPKNLQTLNSDYIVCKNYLKVLINNMVQDRNQLNMGVSRVDYKEIENIVNALAKFQVRKSQLLAQYCEQKLINYQYYLNGKNLCAMQGICRVLEDMLRNKQIPMDFVSSIGNYTTLQHLIQTCQSQQQQPQKCQKLLQKSLFFSSPSSPYSPHSLNPQKTSLALSKLYQQYKQHLTSQLYSTNSQSHQYTSSQKQRQKIFHDILAPHQVIILVYDNIENWILKELLAMNDKNKVKIVFDVQPRAVEMVMGLGLAKGGSGGGGKTSSCGGYASKNAKIVFLVHQSKIQDVKPLFHTVKFLWI